MFLEIIFLHARNSMTKHLTNMTTHVIPSKNKLVSLPKGVGLKSLATWAELISLKMIQFHTL